MTHFIRKIAFLALALLMTVLPCYCQNESCADFTDLTTEAQVLSSNTSSTSDATIIKKPSFFKKIGKGIASFINEFNNVDTNFIEPQHFKFQVMLQNTTTFDRYAMNTDDSNLKLAPRVHNRFGPYVGYSLIFLGYTLQFNHLYIGNAKKNFDLSLYSALGGIDIFYRNNNDMRIRTLTSSKDSVDYSPLRDKDFTGAEVSSSGFDIYYIFNHRKHSYPAAYNQSTCQRRSAGSVIVGFGYSHHVLSMDWDAFDALLNANGFTNPFTQLITNIDYKRYNTYVGYSFNWVPLRNWLVGASVTAAVGFNQAKGDVMRFSMQWKNFTNTNFSLDGTARLGIVWNNTRMFAGASAQVHSYTFSKDNYSLNNLFGNIVVYTGFNFGKKKKYRTSGKFFEF